MWKLDESICYCVGSFIGELYLIGGYVKSSKKSISSCYTYYINNNTWSKKAELNIARDCAAFTEFTWLIRFD